jgi:MFS family permease
MPVCVNIKNASGLALGGEYGGAAAASTPRRTRSWTSWIQTTATVGLFISLMVILATRNILSPEQFDEWGWRVPFWVSIIMVGVSYLIRKNMDESRFCESKIRRNNKPFPQKKVSEIVTI